MCMSSARGFARSHTTLLYLFPLSTVTTVYEHIHTHRHTRPYTHMLPTCTCTYTHSHMHAHTNKCKDAQAYTHSHTCTYTQMPPTYTCTYTNSHTCMHTYIHTGTHIEVHTQTYTLTHIYMQRVSPTEKKKNLTNHLCSSPSNVDTHWCYSKSLTTWRDRIWCQFSLLIPVPLRQRILFCIETVQMFSVYVSLAWQYCFIVSKTVLCMGKSKSRDPCKCETISSAILTIYLK